jgi:hypothetical protein
LATSEKDASPKTKEVPEKKPRRRKRPAEKQARVEVSGPWEPPA